MLSDYFKSCFVKYMLLLCEFSLNNSYLFRNIHIAAPAERIWGLGMRMGWGVDPPLNMIERLEKISVCVVCWLNSNCLNRHLTMY